MCSPQSRTSVRKIDPCIPNTGSGFLGGTNRLGPGSAVDPTATTRQRWQARHARDATTEIKIVDGLVGGRGPEKAQGVMNFVDESRPSALQNPSRLIGGNVLSCATRLERFSRELDARFRLKERLGAAAVYRIP